MASIAFDRVEPAPTFAELPMTMTFRTARSSTALKLLLLAPAMGAMIIPLSLLAVRAVAEPTTLSLLSDRPLASLQVLLGLGLWTVLFLWPIKRIIRQVGVARTVTIQADRIEVIDAVRGSRRSWSEPLAAYGGIAHHVRAGLSGLRHELVLVHADPAKTVLIAIAERIPQSTIDKAKALLRLPEVPAKALYDASLLADLLHAPASAPVIPLRAAA